MKAIICGAGQVGYNLARYLSSDVAEVTIIDVDEELVARATETLDVRGYVGFASHPDVLARAGAENADMLIAVTHADEVNMVACQVAHSLFDVPTRIARLRHKTYLDPRWGDLFSRDHMPIDLIISPEQEVAQAISRRLSVPGAFEIIPFADGAIQLVGVRITAETPVIDTPLRQLSQLFPDLGLTIVSITRGERRLIPTADDELHTSDEVFFVVGTGQLARAMSVFGHDEEEGRRVLIVGGGNIGQALAKLIENDHPGVVPKVVEIDSDRAREAAGNLGRTIVLNGDALDTGLLEDANVAKTETVVAVTNDDEVNVLASLLAKKHGAQRAVTLINRSEYASLIGQLGIETSVSPRAITVSSILQYVRRGNIRAAQSLGTKTGEVIEVEAMETASIVGKQLSKAKIPDGLLVGAIWRDGAVITPRGGTEIHAGDRVIMFVSPGMMKKAEKLFQVSLGFF